jgi:hypothetical protein
LTSLPHCQDLSRSPDLGVRDLGTRSNVSIASSFVVTLEAVPVAGRFDSAAGGCAASKSPVCTATPAGYLCVRRIAQFRVVDELRLGAARSLLRKETRRAKWRFIFTIHGREQFADEGERPAMAAAAKFAPGGWGMKRSEPKNQSGSVDPAGTLQRDALQAAWALKRNHRALWE